MDEVCRGETLNQDEQDEQDTQDAQDELDKAVRQLEAIADSKDETVNNEFRTQQTHQGSTPIDSGAGTTPSDFMKGGTKFIARRAERVLRILQPERQGSSVADLEDIREIPGYLEKLATWRDSVNEELLSRGSSSEATKEEWPMPMTDFTLVAVPGGRSMMLDFDSDLT